MSSQRILHITAIIALLSVGTAVAHGAVQMGDIPVVGKILAQVTGQSQVAQVFPPQSGVSGLSSLYNTCESRYGQGYLLVGFDKNGIVCRKPSVNHIRIGVWFDYSSTGRESYGLQWPVRADYFSRPLQSSPALTMRQEHTSAWIPWLMDVMFPNGARDPNTGLVSITQYSEAVQSFLNGFVMNTDGSRTIAHTGITKGTSLREMLLARGYIGPNDYCEIKDRTSDNRICAIGLSNIPAETDTTKVCHSVPQASEDTENLTPYSARADDNTSRAIMYVDCTKAPSAPAEQSP